MAAISDSLHARLEDSITVTEPLSGTIIFAR